VVDPNTSWLLLRAKVFAPKSKNFENRPFLPVRLLSPNPVLIMRGLIFAAAVAAQLGYFSGMFSEAVLDHFAIRANAVEWPVRP